jgi:cysteine desulfurase
MLSRVYFDHNATTKPAEFLKEKVSQWLDQWGNPSSIHWAGRGPKALLRDSRRAVAQLLGCDPLEIVFTSGGSEANNLAIKGVFEAIEAIEAIESGRLTGSGPSEVPRDHYLLSAVEHPSVTKAMQYLKSRGARVDVIPVNRDGQLDLEKYESLLGPRTALVSVMFANNETGHILPVAKVAKLAHKAGALVHCDGVQALGKARVDVRNWQVDLATFSGHKCYALKGCGVLYVRKGTRLQSLIHGGGQERGRRAGTENLLAIASFATMAEQMAKSEVLEAHLARMTELRDRLERMVGGRIGGVAVTGAAGPRIANTSSMVIEGVDGETLLMNLDMRGFCVSTGAACSSGSPEPSPVLLAMGLSRAEAQSSLRVSLGWHSTVNEVDHFVETLAAVVERLRSFRHGERAMLGV